MTFLTSDKFQIPTIIIIMILIPVSIILNYLGKIEILIPLLWIKIILLLLILRGKVIKENQIFDKEKNTKYKKPIDSIMLNKLKYFIESQKVALIKFIIVCIICSYFLYQLYEYLTNSF